MIKFYMNTRSLKTLPQETHEGKEIVNIEYTVKSSQFKIVSKQKQKLEVGS